MITIDDKDQWYQERWGKLTASENHKLLVAGKAEGEIFGEGAITYLTAKAVEACTVMWERPELEEHKNMLHGRVHELPCYQEYVRYTKNYSMIYLGTENPLFLEYEELKGESGGSPDCINRTSDNKVDAGAEFKCPRNPAMHFERLKWKSQWDLKENSKPTYTQIQNLMLITGAQIWQFVSFDERMRDKSKILKVIDVYPDRKFQDNLDLRLRSGVKRKYRIIEEHMNA